MKFLFSILFAFVCALTITAQFGPKNIIKPNIFGTTVGNFEHDIVTIDWNADGHMDILVSAPWNNAIVWYENMGNGQFLSEQILVNVSKPTGDLNVVDVDNDGDLDLVVFSVGSGGYVDLIWFINSAGTFTSTSIDGFSGCSFGRVKAFDCDNDNDIDFVAHSDCNEINLYRQTSTGFFSTTNLTNGINWISTSPSIGDFNSDGYLDIVGQAALTDSIYIFQNLTNGSFAAPSAICQAENTEELVVFDYDYDGDQDIIYSGKYAYWAKYVVVENNGTFSNWNHSVYPYLSTQRGEIIFSDVDNNNFVDLIAGEEWSIYSSFEQHLFDSLQNSISVLLSPDTLTSTTSDIVEFSIADMNNDGSKDIIALSYKYNQLFWFENFLYSPYKAHGKIFYDENQNGLFDGVDFGLDLVQVKSGDHIAYTSQDGTYFVALEAGNHVIKPDTLQNWDLTTSPDSVLVFVDDSTPASYGADFGFYPTNPTTNLSGGLSANTAVCDTETEMWLSITNEGTTMPDVLINLTLDDSVTFVSSSVLPDSIVGQNIYWSIDSLLFFQYQTILVHLLQPDFNSMNDTLSSYLNVYENIGGTSFVNFDSDTLHQILFCAYDPNDKSVWPMGIGNQGYISNDETLDYTIQFQNTGNYPATNILISDTLDSNLDLSTIEIIGASHYVNINIKPNNVIEFYFPNIMLPDSLSDEPGSHGFIKFSIDLNPNLNPNTSITNTAFIYFDTNPAIVTNTTSNTIECEVHSVNIVYSEPYFTYSSTTVGDLTWLHDGNVLSTPILDTANYNGSGTYTLQLVDNYGCIFSSNSIQLECDTNNFNLIQDSSYLMHTNNIPGDYNWYYNGVVFSSDADTANYAGPGDYSLEFVDQFGCTYYSDTLNIVCLPAILSIDYLMPDFVLTTESMGSSVWYFNNNAIAFDQDTLSFIDSGFYFLEFTDDFGCVFYSDTINMNCIATAPDLQYQIPFINSSVIGAFDFSWFLNDTLLSAINQPSITPFVNGTYELVISDSVGCVFNSPPLIIDFLNQLEINQSPIGIYPNPFSNLLTINLESTNLNEFTIRIIDVKGTLAYQRNYGESSIVQIKTDSFESGLYILLILDSEGSVRHVSQIVKN